MKLFLNLAAILNLLFMIFVLFFERKEDSRRWAWVLVLYFLPVVGIVLYIFLSGHFFTKTKQLTRISYFFDGLTRNFFEEHKDFLKIFYQALDNPLLEEYKSLIKMNLLGNKSILAITTSSHIYCWGQDLFKDMLQDMEAATQSICVESFIIHDDATGKAFMEVLCRKAQQGVEVKLLYDDVGSFLTPKHFFHRLTKAGGQVQAFFPVKWRLPLSINFRNHRKITVIDRKIGYLGGVNIGDEYANCSGGSAPLWRDTHIRLTGTVVMKLHAIFLVDWFTMPAWHTRLKKTEDIAQHFSVETIQLLQQQLSAAQKAITENNFKPEGIPTQILTSGPDNLRPTEIQDALIRIIMEAKHYVYIQSPYFTPNQEIYKALKLAALSGVDVRIMVPDQWDKFYVREAAYQFIWEMLEFGIKFYHYQGFIHSKTLVSDDKVCTIGSTNIDIRSFDLHFETNAIFYDQNVACQCRHIFEQDMEHSRQASSQWFRSKPLSRRLLWPFFKMFSPLM